MEQFRYDFWTGSGSNRVVLTIDGDSARLSIRTNWMGDGEKRYNLYCAHRVLSSAFGVLVVDAIEAAVGKDAPFTPVSIDPEEFLLPLVIEYIRVPASPVYVHEESQNAVAAPLGYAGWNETFEIALLVHDFEGRAESPPLAEICGTIDKVKLAKAADEDKEYHEKEYKFLTAWKLRRAIVRVRGTHAWALVCRREKDYPFGRGLACVTVPESDEADGGI